MITDTVAFDDSIKAFERAAKNLPEDVKIQIQLMNKIGVHALTFIGDIKNHSIEKCLSQVAKIGYDVMELPLLNPDALDTDFVSKTYEKFNIEPTVSLGLSLKLILHLKMKIG